MSDGRGVRKTVQGILELLLLSGISHGLSQSATCKNNTKQINQGLDRRLKLALFLSS